VISNLTPTAGQVGTSVTITGINFSSSQGQVSFNGTAATPTNWSATSITVPVPVGAGSGSISVTVGGQTAFSPFFTVGTLPAGWLDADVGAVGKAGSSSYTNGAFTVNGAGSTNGNTVDAFHFVYQPLSGDGSIVARISSMPTGTSATVGLTIRETLNPGSVNGTAVDWIPGGSLVEFNVRTITGGSTSQAGSLSSTMPPYWIKLVRTGSTLSSYASPDGMNWTLAGSETVTQIERLS
jgi:hypothetical protein